MSEQEFREKVVERLGRIEERLDNIERRLTRVENKIFGGTPFAEKIGLGLLEVVKLAVAAFAGFVGGQLKP